MPVAAPKYEFDLEFQNIIAACALKDPAFNRSTFGLIKPGYFEDDSLAAIVNCSSRYFDTYATTPSLPVVVKLIKDDVDAKIIRSDQVADIKLALTNLHKIEVTDAKYVAQQIGNFARKREMEEAGLKYADLVEKGEFDKAAKVIEKASLVGIGEMEEPYDFFGDKEIGLREAIRNARLAGLKSGSVISTGSLALDNRLFHKGWAKKEYYSLMGPAKSGKSISLAWFAKVAAMAGRNVLAVTLEVSKEIMAERIDSAITKVAMSELEKNIINVSAQLKALQGKVGKLFIEEFPTGTMTPNMLNRLMQKYKSNGIIFDMVVVDYADIMAPNNRTADPIENSKSIYVDLRAIAQIENVVMLSATQTNREGAKASVAKAEHVAEDYNRIRIPDLVISINSTDEERARGECRLYFAASRNQAGCFTVTIKQDLASMQFLESILSIE